MEPGQEDFASACVRADRPTTLDSWTRRRSRFVQVHVPRIRAITETGASPGRRPIEAAPDGLAESFLEYLPGDGGDAGDPENRGGGPPDAL